MSRRAILSLLIVACGAATLRAQEVRVGQGERCRRIQDDERGRMCETRDFTLPATRRLDIDGRQNGGIRVHGASRNDILVVATIQTHAETDADAAELASRVRISTDAGEVRASGPSSRRHTWWSVDYEVWVPRQTDLILDAHNGGISVDSVDARIDLETLNGGLQLTDVSGDVRGHTTNGGITARLNGDRWRGAGLTLRTTNGAVRLYVPESYSATLETGTTNGGIDVGFPITVQGSLGRRLNAQLGNGGPTIRVTTTNGGVSVRRR